MLDVKKYIKKIPNIKTRLFIKRNEKIYREKVKYVYIEKDSDVLMVVFSGFAKKTRFTGKTRKYNFVSSFRDLPVNQLYILDVWGIDGSYYWLDKGNDLPEKLTMDLINKIKREHKISRLITCGSSKGGTAAIYFGLLNRADKIFAGACQFYVGTYLNQEPHEQILRGMIGDLEANKMIKSLDCKLADVIQKNRCSKAVSLFYSPDEPTYERQMIPLKSCLEEHGVQYQEKIEHFSQHTDVGLYFPGYVREQVLAYIADHGKA